MQNPQRNVFGASKEQKGKEAEVAEHSEGCSLKFGVG